MSKLNDKDLNEHATVFLDAFARSARSDVGSPPIDRDRPFTMGAGGYVEITPEIAGALQQFVLRAATLLKAKGAHEKAISDIAIRHGHAFVAQDTELKAAASALIHEVSDKGNASFEYLAPNYLVRFKAVREIRIGRVRALLTEDFAEEHKAKAPESAVQFVPGKEFAIHANSPKMIVEMRPVCWLVNVDAVAENVREEAKWLIDIAVSFLRLSHLEWGGHFPELGNPEPHTERPGQMHHDGAMIQGATVRAGGGKVPPWYEINQRVVETSRSTKFVKLSELIFDPPKKSLAERVGQGLGWLTRGRQSEDRSERLLYFFTAIEALLSTDDKSAPVVQTIARHAAVVLSNDNSTRERLASKIKKLYSSRSALVHAGTRSILWSGTNETQAIAENLYYEVLNKTDLATSHEAFCAALSKASYGTEWPAHQ